MPFIYGTVKNFLVGVLSKATFLSHSLILLIIHFLILLCIVEKMNCKGYPFCKSIMMASLIFIINYYV